MLSSEGDSCCVREIYFPQVHMPSGSYNLPSLSSAMIAEPWEDKMSHRCPCWAGHSTVSYSLDIDLSEHRSCCK